MILRQINLSLLEASISQVRRGLSVTTRGILINFTRQPQHHSQQTKRSEQDQTTLPEVYSNAAGTSAESSDQPHLVNAASKRDEEAKDLATSSEQVQTGANAEPPCSDERRSDATESANQPCPLSADKTVETAKPPSDTAACQSVYVPETETKTPQEPVQEEQPDSTVPVLQPACDLTTSAVNEGGGMKPVDSPTVPTTDFGETSTSKQVQEPQQGDQSTEMSTTAAVSDDKPAEVSS